MTISYLHVGVSVSYLYVGVSEQGDMQKSGFQRMV